MPGRIVLFGASGYTGGLIAEHLVAAGERPVLAGRDTARLEALADRLGADLEVAKAEVYRQNSVFSLVGEGDVLVSTVGPFAKYGTTAVRAAIAAGATYIDSTGEPAFIRRVYEQFDAPAQKKNAKLLTAQGYDYVPGALAGALALEAAGEAATRVEVGYFALGSTTALATSAGTKESMIGATLDPSFAWRDGALATERGAAAVRTFGGRPAVSVGGSEHFVLPAAYAGLRDVGVYLGGFGQLSRAMQAASVATSLAQKVPGSRAVMQAAGEKLVSLTPSRTPQESGHMTATAVAIALDESGTELAEVEVRGGDVYDFTARFMAWAARRGAAGEIEGAGALSTVRAYGGLDALRAGCAEAGLEPTSAVPTAS